MSHDAEKATEEALKGMDITVLVDMVRCDEPGQLNSLIRNEIIRRGDTAPVASPPRRPSGNGPDAIHAARTARVFGLENSFTKGPGKKPGKRQVSPAARKRLSDIAKKRWVKARREGKTTL